MVDENFILLKCFIFVQTSNSSRIGLQNGTTAKRKLRGRKQVGFFRIPFQINSQFYQMKSPVVFIKFQDVLDSDSSSDDIFSRNVHRSNVSYQFIIQRVIIFTFLYSYF